MPSSNLGITNVVASQTQKEVVINDAIEALDNAGNASVEITITTDYVLAAASYTRNVVFELVGAPGAAFEFDLPNTKRLFGLRNQTGQDCNITIAGGAVLLTVTSGQNAMLYSDGTAVWSFGGGGGGGGGLGDAPNDGNSYVRNSEAWVLESTTGTDQRARMGATRFAVRGVRNDPVDFEDPVLIPSLAFTGSTNYSWTPTPMAGATELSYFFLYEATGMPPNEDWLFALNNEIANFHYLTLLTLNPDGSLTIYRDNNASVSASSAAGVIAAGNTYDITVSASLLNTGVIKVYVNGTEVISTTRDGTSAVDTEIGVYMGEDNEGSVARIAMWSTALTGAQATGLHTYKNPVDYDTNLEHFWPTALAGGTTTPDMYGGAPMDVNDFAWSSMNVAGAPVRAGDFLLVGTTAVNEFLNRDNWLAIATGALTFDFIEPQLGWLVYAQDTGEEFVWNGAAWVVPDYVQPPFDVGSMLFGLPAASQKMLKYVFGRNVLLPAGLTGSYGNADVAATAQTDFQITKNGVSIGTMRFAAAATSATFLFASDVSFVPGDILRVNAPGTPDATLADISFTFAGVRT